MHPMPPYPLMIRLCGGHCQAALHCSGPWGGWARWGLSKNLVFQNLTHTHIFRNKRSVSRYLQGDFLLGRLAQRNLQTTRLAWMCPGTWTWAGALRLEISKRMVDDFDDYTMIMGKYYNYRPVMVLTAASDGGQKYQRPHHESIGVVKKLIYDTAEISKITILNNCLFPINTHNFHGFPRVFRISFPAATSRRWPLSRRAWALTKCRRKPAPMFLKGAGAASGWWD